MGGGTELEQSQPGKQNFHTGRKGQKAFGRVGDGDGSKCRRLAAVLPSHLGPPRAN